MLSELAQTINEAQATFHTLHFQAQSGDGGSFDDIHNIMGQYYEDMLQTYDDVVELAIQCGENVQYAPIPQQSNQKSGYIESFLKARVTIESVLDAMVRAHGEYEGNDANSYAVQNYLEGAIEKWSKESKYKIRARIGDNMNGSTNIQLGKALLKAITDADPVGTVRKAGGVSYKKTPAGWVKVPRSGKVQYQAKAEDVIAGLSISEVKKSMELVKYLIRKARRGLEEGHISHRRDGDWEKTGGSWVKVPASDRQGQGAGLEYSGAGAIQRNWNKQNPNSPMQFDDPAMEPPNPVEDKMSNRSLGSIASHGNTKLIENNKKNIMDHIKAYGIDETINVLQSEFESAGLGDMFDMNMNLDQISEMMAQNRLDFPGIIQDENTPEYGFGADTAPDDEGISAGEDLRAADHDAVMNRYPDTVEWNEEDWATFDETFDAIGDMDEAYEAMSDAYEAEEQENEDIADDYFSGDTEGDDETPDADNYTEDGEGDVDKSLGSGDGAGMTPNSPLVGGSAKVKKSFNPMTGIYE